MTGSKGLDTACWLWTGIWSFTLSRTIPYKYAESSMAPDNTAFSSDSKRWICHILQYPNRIKRKTKGLTQRRKDAKKTYRLFATRKTGIFDNTPPIINHQSPVLQSNTPSTLLAKEKGNRQSHLYLITLSETKGLWARIQFQISSFKFPIPPINSPYPPIFNSQ